MNLETLRENLKALENDFEAAKASLYRIDGAVQYARHLVTEAEKSVDPTDATSVAVAEPAVGPVLVKG